MDRSRGSNARLFETLLAAGVLALVLLFATPLSSYVRGLFTDLFAGRNADTELGALSRDALITRLKADEEELSRIKYQSVLYGLIADENARLTTTLHGASSPTDIFARVVSAPPRTLYDTLIVDQGTEAGITEGNLVAYQGIALGRVVSVAKGSALIRLFSSPGNREDALVGTPGAIAVAEGLGGGAFQLSVPQGISVSVGEPVRLQGSPMLLFGTVVAVFSDPSDSSQTVSVRAPVSFADIDFVQVVPSAR